jgi:MFS family permease
MKRLLFSLYGFAFFNKFLLLTPVYAIFMLENGLTDLQLSTMFIVSSVATILGQMPITFITNRMGQRWAMIVGQFLKIIAILLWLIYPTYTGFVSGMVLWGVQAGFRSVAFEGLVYDSVLESGHRREYTRILGRKSTYESIGVALSAFGSLLMFLGYTWVTLASVFAILLSILCLILVPYRPIQRKVQKIQFKKMLRTGIKVCFKTPCLVSIMVLTLLVGNVPYLDDFLSPIALQVGIPTEYVGGLSFFLLACATVGQRYAYKFARLSDGVVYSLIGLVGLGYITFASLYNIGSLWIMGVAYMLFYGIYTLMYSRFQHMIPLGHRSVVLSLYTTLMYIVYMIVCGIIGLGATLGSWRYSIIILGIMMMVLCAWALVYVRNRCRLPQK